MKVNNVFVWNLYKVDVSNYPKPIMVCAPSMIGAIKRVRCLIKSWDTSEQHDILNVSYVNVCVN